MRILMTGATAGIGLVAARRMIAAGHALTIAARNPDAAPADLRQAATLIPTDLGRLADVRRLIETAAADAPFDALVLNGGGQWVSGERSADGLEQSFAVNHLAHFAIARALAPTLAIGGRVVLTASGTHDPAENTGLPPPRHADAVLLAYPERDPQRDAETQAAGRRSYTASKLCNILTARELARRLAAERPDIAVSAFDPAFVPGTGLARSYPWPLPLLFRFLLPLTTRGPRVSTPSVSGGWLADIVLAPTWADARGDYLSVRHRTLVRAEPSETARDPSTAAALWADSERLLAELGAR